MLGEMASAGLLGGVADDRVKASGAEDLAHAAKPLGVAELRENCAREDRTDRVTQALDISRAPGSGEGSAGQGHNAAVTLHDLAETGSTSEHATGPGV